MLELAVFGIGLLILAALGKGGGGGYTITTPGGDVVVNPGSGGKGKSYTPKGTTSVTTPPGWSWSGNRIWVSPDCTAVVEGEGFVPPDSQKTIAVLDAPTLAASMELKSAPDLAAPDNTVYGFLTYLIEQEGINDPGALASRVLSEASPDNCKPPGPAGSPLNLPPTLMAWHADFSKRISKRVELIVNGVG